MKEPISKVFARNLAAAMSGYDKGAGISQAKLAKDSGVGQTTISLYLRPQGRKPTDGNSLPSPTLERLSLLADALKIEPWLLLHPDMEKAKKERDFYRKIEDEFKKLPLPAKAANVQ